MSRYNTDPSKGGVKKDEGKAQGWIYLPKEALSEVARVLDHGAEKYAPGNWRKGMPWSRCYNGAMRHLMAWADGETIDPETGFNHLSHAIANLMFLREYVKLFPEGDDRYGLLESIPPNLLHTESGEDPAEGSSTTTTNKTAGANSPRATRRST